VTRSAAEMAAAIERLFRDPDRRKALERRARLTAERSYGWDAIARQQRALYESLGPFSKG